MYTKEEILLARIDRVRDNYENITNTLFSDNEKFSEYLKFAGKFYKMPTSHSMTIFGSKPNATMVADFDTWKKFNRYVKRGTTSIAVLDNGSIRHYFDISQTSGKRVPYQWALDKGTANTLIKDSGKDLKSFSGYINYVGSEGARLTVGMAANEFRISAEKRKDFEKSFTSMVQYLIASRCELGGKFKYNGNLDLSALDMLSTKAEKERLCEYVQITGKSVLLSMEKSINDIELKRRNEDNERSKTDMVRGGQEVLSRNQNGERQDLQARSDDVRVLGADGFRSDGGRTKADERADRSLGQKVAGVYD